jgi:hypothetical protein
VSQLHGRATTVERLTLVGSPLWRAVVGSLESHLPSTAKVIGAALPSQQFGLFTNVGP